MRKITPAAGEGSSCRPRGARGFTLTEVLIVMTVLAIVLAAGGTIYAHVLPSLRANSALQSLGAELRWTRQQAVSERREYQVSFDTSGQVTIERLELNGALTPIRQSDLPYQAEFTLFAGQPDTPAGFGRDSAIAFTNAQGGAAGDTLLFRGDGAVVDTTGNFVNGTLFLGLADDPSTSRAVTILGATGIVHGYRYDPKSKSFE